MNAHPPRRDLDRTFICMLPDVFKKLYNDLQYLRDETMFRPKLLMCRDCRSSSYCVSITAHPSAIANTSE